MATSAVSVAAGDDGHGDPAPDGAAGGNEAVLEHVEQSLARLRALDKKLRDRLEVLYVALRFGWARGEHAERLQKAGSEGCSAVFARILKEEEEDRKRKKDKVYLGPCFYSTITENLGAIDR
jgi:hypothetical protein